MFNGLAVMCVSIIYSVWCEHVFNSTLPLYKVCKLNILLLATISSTEEKLDDLTTIKGR